MIYIDSETTNGYVDEDGKLCLTDSLTYDISAIIINGKGAVIDKKKYVCDEIFHSPLMKTAYFAEKIPEYIKAINNKEMKVASIMDIYYDFNKFVKKYNVKAIMAHNAKFDYSNNSNSSYSCNSNSENNKYDETKFSVILKKRGGIF